jgi:GntR family transcriptional regulator/MocR family aminotransferase
MLPIENDGIKSSALWQSTADVLHISPYRSFPSGVTATASKRHEYLRWVSTNNRYIIEDDFESEFSVSRKNEETVFSLSKNENCIYMNTFSKTLSSGIRLGYMVLPVSLAEKFEKKLGFYSCTVPTFEQLVIAEILANGSFERHINRVRRYKRKRLDK